MKKRRFLIDFEGPPRLLGIIRRYRKWPRVRRLVWLWSRTSILRSCPARMRSRVILMSASDGVGSRRDRDGSGHPKLHHLERAAFADPVHSRTLMDAKQFFHSVNLSFHSNTLIASVPPSKYLVAWVSIPAAFA